MRELTRLRREKVGFIFQSFQLIHTLTAIENVELPLLLAKEDEHACRQHASVCDGSRWSSMLIVSCTSSPAVNSSASPSRAPW